MCFQEAASSRVSASLSRPHAAEPVRPSQEPEPTEQVHRTPAGSQRPLLARRPLQSLVTPAPSNRAPLVADLVMSDGDKETPSHQRCDGCREESVEPLYADRAVCTIARLSPSLDAPNPVFRGSAFPAPFNETAWRNRLFKAARHRASARASPRRLALGLRPRCFPSMRPLTGRPLFSTACPQTVEESPNRSFLSE